jgi:addiction module HigA family antidote
MAKRKKLPPVHPGEVLREDYLIPAGVTVNALALALRVPVSRMYEIVNCARAITSETAPRLARYLGTSPEFWLGLQSDYDLEKPARIRGADRTRGSAAGTRRVASQRLIARP